MTSFSADSHSASNGHNDLVEHQKKGAVTETLEKHLDKRGVRDNALVTKGAMLLPPYSSSLTERPDGAYDIVIQGGRESPSGDHSVSFTAHNVVATRFRRNAMYFLFDDGTAEPHREVLVPLQESRWEKLNTVPLGDSISKREFMERNRKENGSPESDAPRRWRELRDEFGFNVEEDGGQYHRGPQFAPTSMPEPRPDMSGLKKKYWEEVYNNFKGRCNKCRTPVRKNKDGDKEKAYGLIDHRIPVPYGGSDEIENLQLFCQTCNNRKTRVCRMHPEQFEREFKVWAYPEQFRDSFHLHVADDEANWLQEEAKERDISPSDLAQEILREAIQTRKK